MCGIVGVVSYVGRQIDKHKLRKMNDILIHRGPDFGDVYIDGNVGLGHRRLSIIDLSEISNQPMCFGDSGYWITFNGEIYNYLELKKELSERGYSFLTQSDTEVVLAAYIEWGEACFHKFNGMWALAIYNANTKDMIVCRDRFGVKPLYYYQDENQFLFASEKKAIVLSDFIPLEFDRECLNRVIADPMEFEFSGDTEFKNVKNLFPGSLIRVKGSSIEVERWYTLADHLDGQVPKSFEARCDKFRELLTDACKLRLRADVPIATSLSGGLDSSSIVAILSKLDRLKHKAFIHSFSGSFLDECEFANLVATSTSTPTSEVTANDGDGIEKDIDDILYHFESVYGGMPDAPFRIYREQNKQGYKISMDGHGADEMLAGYPWYLDALLKDIPLYKPLSILKVIRHKRSLSKESTSLFTVLLRMVFDRLPALFKSVLKAILRRQSLHVIKPRHKYIPSGFSHLRKQLYIDFNYTVLPRILKNFDAVSMANSVEVRMPFLDYRLVQYVFSLPDEDLLHHGWTKYILRQSMNDLLHDKVNWRKDKIGFNSPVADLMSGDLKQWTIDAINHSDESLFTKQDLTREFETEILDNPNWNGALSFWKKVNALKIIEIYKGKKSHA